MHNNNLIDTITRKFEQVKEVSDYEIMTPQGWQDISKAMKTIPYKIWKLKTETGKTLECADTHILFNENHEQVFVKDLKENVSYIQTKDGLEKVVSIEETDIEENMYDVEVNSDTHEYYSNDIVSHNTTTVAAYLLHQICFNEDIRVAMLANKADTAREILEKVKEVFEYLPLFLKPNVKFWNKGSIALSNGSKALAAATSSSSIRGKSINTLYLDEMAFIQDIDDFFASTYPVITAGKTTKIIITSCVTKETYVYTNNGIKQVKDFIDKTKPINPNLGYEVQPYSIQGLNKINHGNVMVNSGHTKTRILKSKSSILEASLNHKLWACKNGNFDWYETKDLTIDDYISLNVGCNLWSNNDTITDFIPYQTNKSQNLYTPPKELTKDIMYFLGLFIAEGYINVKNDAVIISCGDNILPFLDFLNIPFKKVDAVHYRVTSKSLRLFMEYLGFDLTKKSKEKIIPTRLLECSKENICALLSGMFDGDGCITKRGTLNYTSTSKILIEQIRMLLLNLGITTQLYTHITKPSKKVKTSSLAYILEILSYKDCKYFLDIVGFRLSRKQERERLLRIPKNLATKDLIPYGRTILKTYNIELPKKWNSAKTPHISREFCLSLKIENEKLQDIIHTNIKWEKIKSIEDSENEVFDFSLPDKFDNLGDKIETAHSVIYNGIIGHQTPLGMNLFYKMYKEAEENKNGFTHISAIWSDHPDRDEKWGKDQLAILGENKFKQEMCCCEYTTNVVINGQNMMIGKLYEELTESQDDCYND